MLPIEDRVTVVDRYQFATGSSDLTMRSTGVSDADVLLAAGFAAANDKRGEFGLLMHRMRGSGDRRGFESACAQAERWLVGRGVRQREKIAKRDARHIAELVVNWWLHDVCVSCQGRRWLGVPGTMRLSATECHACHGSGRRPLETIIPRHHAGQARWLSAEFDSIAAYVVGQMARRIAPSLDLG